MFCAHYSHTYKFMDGQQVDLWERIINLENFREVVHNLVAVIQSKATLLLQTTSGVDPDGDALAVVLALSESLDIFEVSNRPGQKVCRHDRRPFKCNSVEALTLTRLDFLLRHVAERNQILWHLK